MNMTRNIRFCLMFGLALILSIFLSLKTAHACPDTAYPPSASDICNQVTSGDGCDTDRDGYSDYDECSGFTLPKNSSTPVEKYSYLACQANVDNCMNPAQKDLFLIIVSADDQDNGECQGEISLLPEELLKPSTNSPSFFGLGLTVHIIDKNLAPNQMITSSQYAVKMVESCSTADPQVAGETPVGFPTMGLSGTIYTYVIKEKILGPDEEFTTFYDWGSEIDGDLLVTKHIVNTFNHELAHTMSLSVNWDRKIFEHWPAGTGVELDQFVECTSRKGITKCYVSVNHAPLDINGFRLKR